MMPLLLLLQLPGACTGGQAGPPSSRASQLPVAAAYLCLAAILRSSDAISSRLALPRLWVPSCRGGRVGGRGWLRKAARGQQGMRRQGNSTAARSAKPAGFCDPKVCLGAQALQRARPPLLLALLPGRLLARVRRQPQTAEELPACLPDHVFSRLRLLGMPPALRLPAPTQDTQGFKGSLHTTRKVRRFAVWRGGCE